MPIPFKALFPLTNPYFIDLDKKTSEEGMNLLSHDEYNEYLSSIKDGERNGVGCQDIAFCYFRGKKLACKEHYANGQTEKDS